MATVILWGCDDSTEITLDLKPEEVALLERLGDLSEKVSDYQCKPILEVRA